MDRFNNLPQPVKIAIIGISIVLVSVSVTMLLLKDHPSARETLPVNILHDIPVTPPS